MECFDEAKQQYLINVIVPKQDEMLLETVTKRKTFPLQVQENLTRQFNSEIALLESLPPVVINTPPLELNEIQSHISADIGEQHASLLQATQRTRDMLDKLLKSAKMEGQRVMVSCQPRILQPPITLVSQDNFISSDQGDS